jgi:hypothetical protein
MEPSYTVRLVQDGYTVIGQANVDGYLDLKGHDYVILKLVAPDGSPLFGDDRIRLELRFDKVKS